MAVKAFEIKFNDITSDYELRNDVKYHLFSDVYNWNLFNVQNKSLTRLKDVLIPDYKKFIYKNNEEYKGIPTGQEYLDEDGDIISFQKVSKDEHPSRLKYKIDSSNILISSLRGAKTPALYFDFDLKDYVFSNGFYIFKLKRNWNLKFILYILKTKKLKSVLDNNIYRGIGISAYRERDLLNIKIPLVPKTTQDQIVTQIGPIEQKIKDLKKTIKEPQEIINKVFSREIGFDKNLYNEFGKGMTAGTQIAENRTLRFFETEFKKFSRSRILRFSTRYHNTPTKKLMNLLDCMDTLQVKDVIAEPIHRGASPKYNSEGEIPVVKTGHLKKGYVEISQEEFVDHDFYKSSERSQVKENDILIASTGKVSLGKIDLLKIDHEIVVDGHISILRIDEKKYNRLFFTYFFRCILGYFQIERDYTGATNQIELYAKEITNFQIPEIPLEKQQKIVDEIKAELDKQEEINKQIRQERNKIDEIIKKVFI